MKATINPFTREVTIASDYGVFQITLEFTELDEWNSFNFGNKRYDFHFQYDSDLKQDEYVNVYELDEDGEPIWQNNLITKTIIEW